MSEEIDNRNEVVFVFDAQDCNPNGDPSDTNRNKPRVDHQTGTAVVTRYRLNRYLRDQLFDDGHDIFIQSPNQARKTFNTDGTAQDRDSLYDAIIERIEETEDVSDEELFDKLLEVATDIRYFGATLSVSDSVSRDAIPSSIEGPLQFQHARSYNSVTLNDESSRITSVLASSEDNDQGTFGDDYRIKYGLFGFNGVLNENTAENVNLTKEDVRRLDHLMWRSLKNQTITTSKVGQEPLLYARVEYSDGWQIGRLNKQLELESDMDETEIRSIDDYRLDVTDFVDLLNEASERIETVHLSEVDYLPLVYENENIDSIESVLEVPVDSYDPYERYKEMNQ
jgi:CRISPR-associated protein Csh2